MEDKRKFVPEEQRSLLVPSQDLERHLSDPFWRIFDCRHDLADPAWGETQYLKGHIPGAQFAHLDRDLSGTKTGRNGRHPLPSPEKFTAWLSQCGVAPEHGVLAYDDAGGMYAARLWWLLRWVGHERAAVLDGGLGAWIAEGRPLSAQVPHFAPTRYEAAPRAELCTDAHAVETQISSRRNLLLDARSPIRYAGREEKIDPAAGHIPGAENRSFQFNLEPDGRFKDAATLKAEFEQLLGDRGAGEVVHYCGSGVSACHNLFAMELAGLAGSRLYPGSWSEWSSDPRRPVAKG